VDRNGLYRPGVLVAKDEALVTQIKAVMKTHQHYGYRRVAMELGIGKNRAQRVMQRYGLSPTPSPHQRHYKQHKAVRPAPPNVLKDEHVVATYPNYVWACDFTYLWCCGRWYYLATVIDLFNREVVGWNVSIHHDTDLIASALYDALNRQQTAQYLHFDRGSEYLSDYHLSILKSLDITASASAPGSPWQNGFQERFYGSFKTELGSLKGIGSEGELYERVAQTLNYYNTQRIHTKLKTNPQQFRQNYNDSRTARLQPKTGVIDRVLWISGSVLAQNKQYPKGLL
jgi:transposase InsO family protein